MSGRRVAHLPLLGHSQLPGQHSGVSPELGQLSLLCSCSLMLLWEAAIVVSLIRGKNPNSLETPLEH